MKIGILNLPLDNNYGGNLQRYALITTLREMGYEAEHIQLKFDYRLKDWKKPYVYTKRFIKKYILFKEGKFFLERLWLSKYQESLEAILPFYDKYVPHTRPVYTRQELKALVNEYDAFIVGSDQVWRKMIARKYLSTLFLDFLPEGKPRLAYSVSFGSERNELSKKEIAQLTPLYKKFSAVSVREFAGLDLIKAYHWYNPEAIQLLDPTFLIPKSRYEALISEVGISLHKKQEIFCYILDMNDEKKKKIEEISMDKGLSVSYVNLTQSNSIEYWLASFCNAQYIVTDSFHGMVFSIIFNKPFYVFGNEFRGNSRFDSLCQKFQISLNETSPNWNRINGIIDAERERSKRFIKQLDKGKETNQKTTR